MAEYTLSFSPRAKGWTSFHSYKPEWMIGMNNFFYTFQKGLIYKHYDPDVSRNQYYGWDYNSSIKTVFNDAPIEAKMFKTLQLEGNSTWDVSVLTDMDRGEINSSWFEQKEGDYYAYIRRYSNMEDLDLLSAQGVGDVTTVATSVKDSGTTDAGPIADKLIQAGQNFTSTVSVGDTVVNTTASPDTSAIVSAVDSDTQLSLDCNIMSVGSQNYTINSTILTFAFTLDSILSVGDAIYYGSTPTLGGTITAIASNTITISLTSDGSCGTIAGSAPSNGDFILIMKNSIAESYGARGYFMEVQLTNSSTTEVELFSIGSEAFKSFP